jgi:hypothetical protein
MITRLPGAIWTPLSYRLDAPLFTAKPKGWLLHVVVGNGSPLNYWEGRPAGGRAFAHAWVAKDGHSEQYQELDREAWHAAGANATYWGFETEGYPSEPLTTAQIATLARWHVALGVMDAQVGRPGDPGIGAHYQGGALWGGHTCPDPSPGAGPRSRQRTDILFAAAQLRRAGDQPVTPDDAALFLKTLASWDVSGQIGEPSPVNFQTLLGRLYRGMGALQAEVTYLAQQVSILTAAHPAPGTGAPVNVPTQKPTGT